MGNIYVICLALAAVVIGGYGLGKVMYERGYVHGYDDAEHKDEMDFTPEDD